MAVAFSSSAEEVLQRTVGLPAKATVSAEQFVEDISQCFELDRCAKWIRENAFSRVALQFPDDQLPQSVQVARTLESMVTDSKLYILGDTSFGSCCVDEVAAEHAACDSIIHFGHSCLSPPSRLPTLFVLGVYPRDWTRLGSEISQIFAPSDPSAGSPQQLQDSRIEDLLVIIDTAYCSQLDCIRAQLPPGAVIGAPLIPSDNEKPPANGQIALRRLFPTTRPLADFGKVLWIGEEGQALVNVLLQFSSMSVWSYDPEQGTLQRQGTPMKPI